MERLSRRAVRCDALRCLRKGAPTMPVITVDESNSNLEFFASKSAISDFLYMYFNIAGDCLPTGDWDRAELGAVDPFRYIDIDYDCKYQIRSNAEIRFMREAAAVNLLCRLARIHAEDEEQCSTVVQDFRQEHILGNSVQHSVHHWD